MIQKSCRVEDKSRKLMPGWSNQTYLLKGLLDRKRAGLLGDLNLLDLDGVGNSGSGVRHCYGLLPPGFCDRKCSEGL